MFKILGTSSFIDRWMTKEREFYYLTDPENQFRVTVHVKAMTESERPVSIQAKTGDSKNSGDKVRLSDMLMELGKKELISLAKRHTISGYSHLSKPQLPGIF